MDVVGVDMFVLAVVVVVTWVADDDVGSSEAGGSQEDTRVLAIWADTARRVARCSFSLRASFLDMGEEGKAGGEGEGDQVPQS